MGRWLILLSLTIFVPLSQDPSSDLILRSMKDREKERKEMTDCALAVAIAPENVLLYGFADPFLLILQVDFAGFVYFYPPMAIANTTKPAPLSPNSDHEGSMGYGAKIAWRSNSWERDMTVNKPVHTGSARLECATH